jgi:hypothetical protein
VQGEAFPELAFAMHAGNTTARNADEHFFRERITAYGDFIGICSVKPTGAGDEGASPATAWFHFSELSISSPVK